MARLVVFFGSQTGCAKDIAEGIHAEAEKNGLSPSLLPLNSHKKVDFSQPTVAVIVVSTTGNGEPPENAERFWRWLRKRSHPKDLMQQVYYTVLALGDTNYTKFCQAGKNIVGRMNELGGVSFHALACADDAVGLEDTVEPWKATLWGPLDDVLATIKAGRIWVPPTASEGGSCSLPPVASASTSALCSDPDSVPPLLPDSSSVEALAGAGSGAGPSSSPLVPIAVKPDASPTASSSQEDTKSSDEEVEEAESSPLSTLSPGVLSFQTLYPGPLPPLPAKGIAKPPPCLLAVELAPPPSPEASSRRSRRPSSVPPDCSETASTLSAGDRCSSKISASHPYQARVCHAEYLTSGGASSSRRVIHLGLDIASSGLAYVPGDSIGVVCPNEGDVVDALLPRLGFDPEAWVSIEPASTKSPPVVYPRRCPLRTPFLQTVDILNTPKKSFLSLLAASSTGDDAHILRFLASRDGRSHYDTFVVRQRLTLLDLLTLFPSCKPPMSHLLSALPALPPRYYSIASSQLAHPGSLCVAFSVVKYDCVASTPAATATVSRNGLCSNWLERKCDAFLSGSPDPFSFASTIPIFPKPTRDFILPGNPEWPVIMIGPGTGVAPFIGFLEHRECRMELALQDRVAAASGRWRSGVGLAVSDDHDKVYAFADMHLYFGNQRPDVDFLFKEKLEAFVSNRVLSHLHTAFSRAQDHKVYVQHRLKENGAQLADLLLKHSAFVYVCGDGAHMARDVQAALTEILQSHGGLSQAESKEAMLHLRQQHRYVEDIWS